MSDLPRAHWVDVGLRPTLVAVMLTCLTVPAVLFVEQWWAGWRGSYFLAFCFLANLEGILSERALNRQRITGWGYLGSRAVEFLVLWLVLKLFSYIPDVDALWADAQRWAARPEEFVSVPDMITGPMFLVSWLVSIYLSRQLAQLDVLPDQAPPDKTSTDYYLWLTQPSMGRERGQALDQLVELFFMGGAALLVMAALLSFTNPALPTPIVAILSYFALGIVLVGQAQFSVLQAGWQIQRIDVQPNIARRWLVWAAVFLLVVTIVALVLPTTYGLGPLQALLGVLALIAHVVLFAITTVVFILALLVSFLFPAIPVPVPRGLQPPSAGLDPPSGGPQGWLQVLVSALFWAVVIGIVGYALLRFLRERLGVAELEGGWWAGVVAWLRGLRGRWGAWRQEVVQRGARRVRRAPRLAGLIGTAPFSIPRSLAPRDLIRYFYLSTVQRAGRAGCPRGPSQTPYEFQANLDVAFPELEPDLSGLTEAFIEARYSARAVAPEEARAVKPLWQRIKEALQRRVARSPLS